MDLQISGKDFDLGSALREHVEMRLTDAVEKYTSRPAQASVTFAKEGSGVSCHCTAHLDSGIVLKAEGSAGDAYSSFDDAAAKLEKRVRRYKRRLKNHHADKSDALSSGAFSDYVLAESADMSDEGAETDTAAESPPVVVAETKEPLYEMTVQTAVMHMDLADKAAFIFKHAGNGRINVVYRRPDGHIGWIDPN